MGCASGLRGSVCGSSKGGGVDCQFWTAICRLGTKQIVYIFSLILHRSSLLSTDSRFVLLFVSGYDHAQLVEIRVIVA